MTTSLTRRSLLAAGAGAVAAAGLGRVVRVATAAAAGPALNPARLAAYASLTDAVATGPAMRLAPGAAAQTAGAFAAVYAGWPAQRRVHADQVLDRIHRRGAAAFADQEALALAAVTLGPDDDGRAPLAI